MLLYLAKYGTYQCRVWTLIDTADTATRIPSFTASAYLVTESYGGKVLDSFSIKRLNRFSYLPETQAPVLFEQALAINVAVFSVSSTQAVKHGFLNFSRIWSVQFGKTPRYGLRYLPTMTPTEGRPDQEKRYGVLQSYARCIYYANADLLR